MQACPATPSDLALEDPTREHALLCILDDPARAPHATALHAHAHTALTHTGTTCSIPLVLLLMNGPSTIVPPSEWFATTTASLHHTMATILTAIYRPIPIQYLNASRIDFWASLTTPFSSLLCPTLITPTDHPANAETPLIIHLLDTLASTTDHPIDPDNVVCRAEAVFTFPTGLHRCTYNQPRQPGLPGFLLASSLGHFLLLSASHALSPSPHAPPVPPPAHAPLPERMPITSGCLLEDKRFPITMQFGALLDEIIRMKRVPKAVAKQFQQDMQRLSTCSRDNSLKIFPTARLPLNRILLYEQLFTEIRNATEPLVPSAPPNSPLFGALKHSKAALKLLKQKASPGPSEPVPKPGKSKQAPGGDVTVNPRALPCNARLLPHQRTTPQHLPTPPDAPSVLPEDAPAVMPVLLPYLTMLLPNTPITSTPSAADPLLRCYQKRQLQCARRKLIEAVSKFGSK